MDIDQIRVCQERFRGTITYLQAADLIRKKSLVMGTGPILVCCSMIVFAFLSFVVCFLGMGPCLDCNACCFIGTAWICTWHATVPLPILQHVLFSILPCCLGV